MNKTHHTVVGVGFFIAVILLVVFGGGTIIAMMSGVLGNGPIGGISFIWVPVLLILSVGLVFAWPFISQKNNRLNKDE